MELEAPEKFWEKTLHRMQEPSVEAVKRVLEAVQAAQGEVTR